MIVMENYLGSMQVQGNSIAFRERNTGKTVAFSSSDMFILYVEDSSGKT